MDADSSHKRHNPSTKGRKALKKKKRDEDNNDQKQKGSQKAFAFTSVKKAEKRFRHKQELLEKKKHIPVVDRSAVEPPPFVVAVVGPAKVGKSTLIKSLIKHMCKETLNNIRGPVTVVSGKKRRVTFIESNCDINNMIDISKVCDLALLLVDASFGFEMETFEFLNICQAHGFPRIMGVLTHLDVFKSKEKLKKAKKTLKHRFWSEVYQGAKLFYLSALVKGEYLKNDVKNLARFISVMKFRPLQWRATHPYLLVDRMEDLTNQELVRQNPKCDRTVTLYGYTRGGFFKPHQDIHIPGCGDFQIAEISFLVDPCPLPSKEKQEKRRSLNQKEKLIYAPFSGVGGVLYDKDAVYIDLGGSHSHKHDDNSQGTTLLSSILDTAQTINEKIEKSDPGVKLFSATHSTHDDAEESDSDGESNSRSNDSEDSDDGEMDNRSEDEISDFENGDDDQRFNRRRQHGDEIHDEELDENVSFDESEDEEEDETLKWKESMLGKASVDFYKRQESTKNIQKLVYEKTVLQDEDFEGENGEFLSDGLLKVVKRHENTSNEMKHTLNSIECTLFPFASQKWTEDDILRRIKDCFVTGKWNEDEDAETLIKDSTNADFDDFEDLEMNEPEDDEDEQQEVENDEGDNAVKSDEKEAALRREKKRLLKEAFDSNYDDGGKKDDENSYFDQLKAETEKQAEANRSEFEGLDDATRVQYEGFRPGMYVRIEVKTMPCEFVENFNPVYPVIVGGLLSGETDVGYVQVRIKKHRWYKKILKSKDPLIFSMGWKRFQTIPMYAIQDHNGRNRLLKYTPEHLHCHASFWGPITPQGTGFVAFQSVSQSTPDFRIAATGVVLNLDKSTTIVKKLKLVGSAIKIFKKTAFIKGMFNSALEVTKFEGASIRTVSGIRGQIKKAIKAPAGAFRATFEDKILLSDIVFMRTWFTVSLPKYYTYVNTLLLPEQMKMQWLGMKTTGQLRHERGLKPAINSDSLYAPTKRKNYTQKPLVIPKALQKELPYSAKPKFCERKEKKVQRVTVVREPEEKKVHSVLQMVRAANKEKKRRDRQLLVERVARHKKEIQSIENRKATKERQIKKQVLKALSKTKRLK